MPINVLLLFLHFVSWEQSKRKGQNKRRRIFPKHFTTTHFPFPCDLEDAVNQKKKKNVRDVVEIAKKRNRLPLDLKWSAPPGDPSHQAPAAHKSRPPGLLARKYSIIDLSPLLLLLGPSCNTKHLRCVYDWRFGGNPAARENGRPRGVLQFACRSIKTRAGAGKDEQSREFKTRRGEKLKKKLVENDPEGSSWASLTNNVHIRVRNIRRLSTRFAWRSITAVPSRISIQRSLQQQPTQKKIW